MNLNVSPPITPNSPNSQAGGTTAATGSQSLSKTSAGCTPGSGLKSAKGLKQPKPKKCKVCRAEFTPTKPMQSVCTTACALSLVATKKAKAAISAKTAERKETKAKREKLKSRADWAKEAQEVFNKWVRLRDADKPCISCGRHHTGQYHAGHYLSRGARPELAFEPMNVWKQCSACNTHLSGNVAMYRVNLVELIGQDMVEWLEGPHDQKKYSIDDLKKIKAIYSAKCREMEKK